MVRAALAPVLIAFILAPAQQSLTTLRIRVALTTADGTSRPVPRFTLLVSDNPTSAPPRRAVTASDGTAELHVPAGSYTIESDRPVTFDGKSYEWAQTVTLTAGHDLLVELNERNALAGTTPATPDDGDASAVEMQWRDSIVELWSETAHGSGFLVDRRGLIATNQRIVGASKEVEVQLSPAIKVRGQVLAADATKNVAVIRVDPAIVASMKPMAVRYDAQDTLRPGDTVFTIGVPLLQEKQVMSGKIARVDARTIDTDVDVANGSSGGPVFTASGDVIGITTIDATSLSALTEVVRIDEGKGVLAAAAAKVAGSAAPAPVHLPVEPTRRIPEKTLEAIAAQDGVRMPYEMPAADFDVHFITPMMMFAAQSRARQAERRARTQAGHDAGPPQDPFEEFENWRDYVTEFLPVLMIRVTPKMGEGFWQALGRNAAQTQGVAIPAIKHVKAAFSRLRLYCGPDEVAPIHPFKIVHALPTGGDAPASDFIDEGLYVFAPDAIGPQCGTVKIVVFGDKDAQRGESLTVDPGIVQRLAQELR